MKNYIIANKNTKLSKAHFLYGFSPEGREFYKDATLGQKHQLLHLLMNNGNIYSQDFVDILITENQSDNMIRLIPIMNASYQTMRYF